tara:strand:+ start:1787 stop:2374 length:588 start_codon:yes stop_codon:yes gene_type:complete
MTTLLYLHGYNSSSQSKKALQTQHWIASNAPYVDFICPDLPPFADCAMKLLNTIVEARSSRPLGLIGSSMGGFFATCLIEKYDLRGVLINPAVSPARGLESWLGVNENYITGNQWTLRSQDIKEFNKIDPPKIRRQGNYLVFVKTGDEVLDYQDAETRYTGNKIVVEQGGDHSFKDYDQKLSDIFRFLFTINSTN